MRGVTVVLIVLIGGEMKFIQYLEDINIAEEAVKLLYGDRDETRNTINIVNRSITNRINAKPNRKKNSFAIKQVVYSHTRALRPAVRKMENRNKPIFVSICIPTFRDRGTIDRAVESALSQAGKNLRVEVIISVNGGNSAWAHALKEKFCHQSNISVICTEKAGASAGRNEAIAVARGEFICFLDDDDRLSSSCVRDLADCIHPKADIVCGPMSELGAKDAKYSYFNKGLARLRETGMKNASLTGIFSSVCAKLIRKSFLESAVPFDETISSSEDLLFWAANYPLLRARIAFVPSSCKGSYEREVTANSVSRPTDEREFSFNTSDRLAVISRLEKMVFKNNLNRDERQFILNLISAQTGFIERYYDSSDMQTKDAIYDVVSNYSGKLLNKGRFSQKQGIAFCHNFSPSNDPSAMVATKRLNQINAAEQSIFNWHVISKNMSDIRTVDSEWDKYFASFTFTERVAIQGKTSDAPRAQLSFALQAYLKTSSVDAEVVYSRSMFPGSHIAAYLYKRRHPNVIWYAEFSDPIAYTSSGTKRDIEHSYFESYLDDFYESCEILPYKWADHVIFTNSVQREYMLGYCSDRDAAMRAAEKSLVWVHPMIDGIYAQLIDSKWKPVPGKINIGFFGSFYARRNTEPLIKLASSNDVVLHLFVPDPAKVKIKGSNVVVKKALPYFEFLNVAKKMDYLFLNDMESLDGITPWLPSKLSDYLATGTKIIACCNEGSPLCNYESASIIKVNMRNFDDHLIDEVINLR